MDFEHTVHFTVEDVIHAKAEYEKLLHMAQVKAEYVRRLDVKDPMCKLASDIQKATLTEIVHIHNMLTSLEKIIDKYLAGDEGGSA